MSSIVQEEIIVVHSVELSPGWTVHRMSDSTFSFDHPENLDMTEEEVLMEVIKLMGVRLFDFSHILDMVRQIVR